MKNTANQNKFAASTQKILPGAETVQLRPARADTRREVRLNLMESVLAGAQAGAAGAKEALPIPGPDLMLASDGHAGRLSPVDQMSKVISREVRIFQRTADESMEVVLTPDQNTQISLRLQWREGKVEILAHCHQGDFPALSMQWSQLQTALGHQGVRLAQLTHPTHTAFTEFFGSTGFAQSRNGGQPQSRPRVAPDELPSAAVIKPVGKLSPSAAARARRLLESWA